MVFTKNIKLVACLRFKGTHPEKVEKLSRGKARYHFKIEQEQWMELQKEFDRSDFLRYAQCLDAVVDLAY